MPDRHQPDESSGEPRCTRTCELLESVNDTMETMVQICGVTARGIVVGELCRPRVRELVQISRRRCDGCEHWREMVEDDVTTGDGVCSESETLWCDYESCSRWEERRG
jgi:hypothetical protein